MAEIDITTNYIDNNAAFANAKYDNMQVLMAVKDIFARSEEEGVAYFEQLVRNSKFYNKSKIDDYRKCFEFFRKNKDAFSKTNTETQIIAFTAVSEKKIFTEMINAYINSPQVSLGVDMVKLHKYLEDKIKNKKLDDSADSVVAKTFAEFRDYCYNHVSENYKKAERIKDFNSYVEFKNSSRDSGEDGLF